MAKIDDLLWACYSRTSEFLAELEAVEASGDMTAAGRYIAVMTKNVEPLRRAIEAVERHEREDAQREAAAEDRVWLQ